MAAVVVPGPPSLHPDLALSLYYTTDPLLSNAPVLIFYGPASTIGATSSRIQVHIFTPAGTATYARLAVSPNSPFYTAVSNLPREEQGDEVCRGLAFALRKYFAELSRGVTETWCVQAKAPSPSALFGDDHVAILATRVNRVENIDAVTAVLSQAFAEQRQSWQDVDVVLPPGTIKPVDPQAEADDLDDADLLRLRYGRYADIIASLGDQSFLPTSKLKRAPSKASFLGRNISFLKHQKENARRDLCELLETEESYIERVKELNQISTTLGSDLQEAVRDQLRSIFPASIALILEVNSDFRTELRSIMLESEDPSTQDIEATSEADTSVLHNPDPKPDSQGLVAVAKCLCEWLTKFAEPYHHYLSAHAEAAQHLRGLFRSSDSGLTAEIQNVGEQRLVSLLIEPVQRLPRYNLYIDGITKQLPVRHPAIKHFLKARDLITKICSQDDGENEASKVIERLRARVSEWPSDASVHGRLVTAADFLSLPPPFTLDAPDSQPGLLLLFTDCIVLLAKPIKTSINARVLVTELESGLPVHRAERANTPTLDLHFLNLIPLTDVDCTEGHGGKSLHMYVRSEASTSADVRTRSAVELCLALKLEALYEGKASKLMEDIVKAKIEGRFSEAERESATWEARASDPVAEHCSLFSAVFDDSIAERVSTRAGRSGIRVLVDFDRHSHKPRAGNENIHTLIALSPLKDGLWRMTMESLDSNPTKEHVPTADMALVLSKRLAMQSASRFAIDHPSTTAVLLAQNMACLQQLDLEIRQGDEGEDPPVAPERPKRSRSPVKLLSSFLSSSGPGAQVPALHGKSLPPLPPPSHASSFGSFSGTGSKPSSREGRPVSRDAPLPMVRVRANPQIESESASHRLEDTLGTYLLALQARKGNIVGRSLKMRANADELSVNELYNKLLEDPNTMALAAQASVDVLFAAFEKFLNVAWKDNVGQILPLDILNDIQDKAETLFPVDFDEFFRKRVATLAPENQRAFQCIMKLLADLLDGTGNDGDRGMLTAAFAEVLIPDGKPHDFIPLIDRFVDDTDTYFGEPFEGVPKPFEGSISGHKRARSLNSSSITSNTSSFRRKLGFSTLGRANSKPEEESRMTTVWRSLSKSTRAGDASPASISKASSNRLHSSVDSQAPVKRPDSRDGGKAGGSIVSAPGNQSLGLSTIGENATSMATGPPRKKRRSSLSDLPALEVTQRPSPFQSPPSLRPTLSTVLSDDTTLFASQMTSMSSANMNSRMESPSRASPRSRLPASFRRQPSPSPAKIPEVPEPTIGLEDAVSWQKPASGIPKLTPRTTSLKGKSAESARAGLSERPNAGNIVKKQPSSPEKAVKLRTPAVSENTSPRKLKMQSPQKLRERLQNEQSAISKARTSLQDELVKIGDELTAAIPQHQSFRTPKSGGRAQMHSLGSMELAQRVLKMEGALPQCVDELNGNIEQIRSDLTTSLAVSEHKCRKLDELYREANGENEALYAKFNEELSRIMTAVRAGEGVEELKKQLKESQEETARLRRETNRLKRENVGLRAQLKD